MKRFLPITVLAVLGCASALAQDWPTKPVTMVVPFAAGGPLDVLARILQPYVSETLGQQVVVENVTGGGGVAGTLKVSQAAPDGNLFVLGSVGTHAMSPAMRRKPAYDAVADFEPVILVADAPLVLAARKDLPGDTLAEFIPYVRANQAKLQYGSAGVGTSSHVGCVLLNQVIGVDVVHVPYRGGGPAIQDLAAGRIDYLCTYVSNLLPAVRRGSAKAVATLAAARVASFPEVATADEQGLKGFDVSAWNALFLPKGAPAAHVARLNAAVSKALDNPALHKRLEDIGLVVVEPARRSPEYLRRYVEAELAKWAEPIRKSGLVGD